MKTVPSKMVSEEEMFAALVAYQNRFGDCIVPYRWPENPTLGGWVSTQRHLRKASELEEDHIRRLDGLGFVWNIFDAAWEKMFAALVAYQNRFGDCNVPQGWPENPTLRKWVDKQRGRRKANRLEEDRIRRLDELGFVWDRKRKRAKSHQ